MPRTAAPRTPSTPDEKKGPTKRAASARTPRKTAGGQAAGTKAPAKTTARKTTARKTAAAEPGKATKKATTSAARAKTTQAAAKKATAWPEFITHKMITAHYQARLHRLPVRNIRDWRELADGTAALHFPSGARLDHTPTEDAPFHANTPCPYGSLHRHPVRTGADLEAAEKIAKACTDHAGSAQAASIAITRVLPAAAPAENTDKPEPQPRHDGGRRPIPSWAQQLPGEDAITETIPVPEEPVARAAASAADTHSMSIAEIYEGLVTRAAEDIGLDATLILPKEHPEP